MTEPEAQAPESALEVAPRGGVYLKWKGEERLFLLDMKSIDDLQKAHGSIYALASSFAGHGPEPSHIAVLDVLALGAIGGGLDRKAAKDMVKQVEPSELYDCKALAMIVLTSALYGSDDDGDDDEEGNGEETDPKA